MAQDIEELALSGKLFSTSRSSSLQRSSSGSRSPSPDPLWPTNGNSTDSELSISPPRRISDFPDGLEPLGMSPGRTGVKGVLRDRNEAVKLEQAKIAQKVKETNRRMEKMALSARTYAEDEEERILEQRRQEGRSDDEERIQRGMVGRPGWFGHLREINMAGFLDAIENEMSETWVLIHIYDPSLQRCHDLDAVLARLARQYPRTKFLRARAGALDFFSSAYPRRSTNKHQSGHEKESCGDEENDPYFGEDEEEEEQTCDATDTDMLPTLLAYRAGELVHTWVRVDWEAEAWTPHGEKGKETHSSGLRGLEGLLQGHYVIQPSGNGNCGFSSDDEDLDQQNMPNGDNGDGDDEIFDL